MTITGDNQQDDVSLCRGRWAPEMFMQEMGVVNYPVIKQGFWFFVY